MRWIIKKWKFCRVGRFRIPLDGSGYGELEAALDPDEHGRGMDMCSFNPAYLGKKYRYAYACGAERPCNFPNTLTKVPFSLTYMLHLCLFYLLPRPTNSLYPCYEFVRFRSIWWRRWPRIGMRRALSLPSLSLWLDRVQPKKMMVSHFISSSKWIKQMNIPLWRSRTRDLHF